MSVSSIVGRTPRNMDYLPARRARRDWRRLPVRHLLTGNPIYVLLDGERVLDVAQEWVQEGRLGPIAPQDEALYRLIAAVFARV